MKTTVRVQLVAYCEVEIEVEHEEDEDPCDLTAGDRAKAELQGESFPNWEVERVLE